MANPFVHIELQTQDLEKSKKFYAFYLFLITFFKIKDYLRNKRQLCEAKCYSGAIIGTGFLFVCFCGSACGGHCNDDWVAS